MKVVGIGDLLIPQEYIMEGFKNFKEAGHEVETIQWKLASYEELQNINLEVELHGSEAVEPPQEVLDAIHDADIVITEVGGTTGDIESQPFIEAIRQVGNEVGKENSLYIHVCLLP